MPSGATSSRKLTRERYRRASMLTPCSEIPNGTYPKEDLIDGAMGAAQTAAEVGAESNLDFQASWPLIWPQKEILFQTDDQYIEINQTDAHTPYLGFWNSKSG
jgi:tripeptidyl-peptidase-1